MLVVSGQHRAISGDMRIGEMTVPDGMWTSIMSLPIRVHGDVGETNVTCGVDLGRKSQSRSLSFSMI